jgi:hypothetical protein
MLANVILMLHFSVVLFIVAGLPLVCIGAACRWAWVRAFWWRAAHLAAIVIVAGESLVGIACPLTVWEDTLRGRRLEIGFVGRWLHRLLFYDASAWVFTLCYVSYAVLVAAAWIMIPPRRPAGSSDRPKAPGDGAGCNGLDSSGRPQGNS